MYAKICGLELLSSYITELGVGDILSLQALVRNPLDWHHFYEKLSLIKKGGKTDFIVVTREGDRLVGSGIVQEVEKWSNGGKYGFKIKVNISKQKSLADRRIKLQNMPQGHQNSVQQKPTQPSTPVAPLTPPNAVQQQQQQQQQKQPNNSNMLSEIPELP